MSPTRCLILSVGLVLIAAVPAIAQDPDALTRAAQSALHRADGLADRNIAVRVLPDGTAILSGPARPAMRCARAVKAASCSAVTRWFPECRDWPARADGPD